MRQLYIDGKPAVIKSGSSFKFYRENIYFTEAEDYTLDVTLPLQGCPENLDIFTAIHRPEMSLVHLIGKKYPFHFISPPLDISGSAIVTEVNEKEVKVQLLAGATGLDLETIGKDIYIDELDLGKAFDVTHPGLSVYDGPIHSGFYGAQVPDIKAVYESNPNKCVFFPVYSEGSDIIVNKHRAGYGERNGFSFTCGTDYEEFSAQPYLLLIIERVLNAIGYELDPNNAIAKSWQRNIFIANGRNEFKYANILPHWTVSEFLKEISLFCGVNFTVDGNVVSAIRRSDYYTDEGEYVPIENVIDEFTVDIEDEAEGSKDTTTGNVGYDFENIDPMLLLPEDVWQKAVVVGPFPDYSSMEEYANTLDRSKSLWLFTVSSNHKVYAFVEEESGFHLSEVDMIGSIIRNDRYRKIDVSLRIIPAQTTYQLVGYNYTREDGRRGSVDNAFYVPMLTTPQAIDKRPDYFSVNDAINHRTESSPEPSRPDRLEVALYDGKIKFLGYYTDPTGASIDVIIPFSLGIPYARGYDSSGSLNAHYNSFHNDKGSEKSLMLKEGTPMFNILSSGEGIDTRVKHCFQFMDDIGPNPKDIFIVRGRKYACQKIEYTCEDEGVSPIKRGYFYEINN